MAGAGYHITILYWRDYRSRQCGDRCTAVYEISMQYIPVYINHYMRFASIYVISVSKMFTENNGIKELTVNVRLSKLFKLKSQPQQVVFLIE
ncbi:CLUMA_CG008866, isoform A [Clunio marinus]|uniref:CLUMA_CG008866, isoform A n=1 Tax=Clunio marinus TaxID=568069 RepID=A0A1J1I892_9DIPT|nr:CLUMA_CG008866, isoform A [Clunio marinus]